MAVAALGWLGSKLGVDITGREKKPDEGGIASDLGGAIFGGDASTNSNGGAAEELDENGLPKSRDWYHYNEELKRFEPTPNAPEWVKAEHAEKVRAMEAEARGENKVTVAPPPPPPPGGFAAAPMRSPNAPQYADAGFFSGGAQGTPTQALPASPATASPPSQ